MHINRIISIFALINNITASFISSFAGCYDDLNRVGTYHLNPIRTNDIDTSVEGAAPTAQSGTWESKDHSRDKNEIVVSLTA